MPREHGQHRTRSSGGVEEPLVSVSNKRKQNAPKKKVIQPILQEIRRLQDRTDLLIPRRPFGRVIREILLHFNERFGGNLRIQSRALEALQEAAEIYLTQLMEDAYRCTLHRNRVTLEVKDIALARIIRGMGDLACR